MYYRPGGCFKLIFDKEIELPQDTGSAPEVLVGCTFTGNPIR